MSRSDLLARWARCGGTANFLARYLLGAGHAFEGACSMVFNEVIENAAKYASPGDTSIDVEAWLGEGGVGIETRHPADPEQVAALEAWLERSRKTELDAVIEHTAAVDRGASRLGLLTVLRSYDAHLSVRVEPARHPPAGRQGRPAPGEVIVRVEIPFA